MGISNLIKESGGFKLSVKFLNDFYKGDLCEVLDSYAIDPQVKVAGNSEVYTDIVTSSSNIYGSLIPLEVKVHSKNIIILIFTDASEYLKMAVGIRDEGIGTDYVFFNSIVSLSTTDEKVQLSNSDRPVKLLRISRDKYVVIWGGWNTLFYGRVFKMVISPQIYQNNKNLQAYMSGGPVFTIESRTMYSWDAIIIDKNKIVVAFGTYSGGSKGVSIILTASGDMNYTVSNQFVFKASEVKSISLAKLKDDTFLISYQNKTLDKKATSIFAKITETSTITYYGDIVLSEHETDSIESYSLNENKVLVFFRNVYVDKSEGKAVILNISEETTIQLSSEYIYINKSPSSPLNLKTHIIKQINKETFMIMYKLNSNIICYILCSVKEGRDLRFENKKRIDSFYSLVDGALSFDISNSNELVLLHKNIFDGNNILRTSFAPVFNTRTFSKGSLIGIVEKDYKAGQIGFIKIQGGI